MTRVKIYGAGSIGNHLAHGCREHDWAVTMCDTDPAALERTRTSIYPERYGAWDDAIRLCAPSEAARDAADVVIIGTPPDTHVPLALQVLDDAPPRLLLIEKPLCAPDLDGCARLVTRAAETGTRVLVGYNHRVTEHTRIAAEWAREASTGAPTTLRARFREHWGGIFGAHPWLSGPADTYLGYTSRGGGALGEHSHAINLWQYFAGLAGLGRIIEVGAMLDEVDLGDGVVYDRVAQLSVRTESGIIGTIVQDVVTQPAEKWLRLEGERGNLTWQANAEPGVDLARLVVHGEQPVEHRVQKTRPDDFRGEIVHLAALLEDPAQPSPLSLTHGLETMAVIVAALESARGGRRVPVNYEPAARAG